MNATERTLIQEGQLLFSSILMKYDYLEKEPVDVGGELMNASQIHTIEAIGKDLGNTVTALAGHFMITRGAVSQIVSKLCEGGYVEKSRREGNEKEILLDLTAQGRKAFEAHERLNETSLDLRWLANRHGEAEIRVFLDVLRDIDRLFGKFIEARGEK